MSEPEKNEQSESDVDQQKSPKRFGCLSVLLHLSVLAVGVFTLLAFFGRSHWAIELITHFRVQYFATAAVLIVPLLMLRQFRWTLLALCIAILNAVTIFPVYVTQTETAEAAETTKSIRILFANVYVGNEQADLVLELVRETEPDIVLFAETHERWIAQLDALKSEYPYSISESNRGAFGVTGYSRVKLDRLGVEWFGDPSVASVPAVIAETQLDGNPIRIIGAHVASPGDHADLLYRTSQMQHLAEFAAQREMPTAIIGDLNVSPWSPYFDDMLNAGELRDSRQGFGNHASWPDGAAILRIPIDHCLVTEEISVLRREVCRSVGSDHFPLLVELAIRTTDDAELTSSD